MKLMSDDVLSSGSSILNSIINELDIHLFFVYPFSKLRSLSTLYNIEAKMSGVINFSSEVFINKLKIQDAEAISEVVKAYTQDLLKASKGLGFSYPMDEELVQNVWVTFFDIVKNFQGKSHIKTFIFGILYNKASELRRDNSKFDKTDPIEEFMDKKFDKNGSWIQPPIDPEQFYSSSQVMSLIQKCIDALPMSQRMAFCLKEIDGHISSEICNILELSVTNLGVVLFRAKNRLRECIEAKSK